jgi:hypothetical protein
MAKRLQRAKAELKRLELKLPSGRSGALRLVRARRALPEHLVLFVDLETRPLEMIDHPGGEHLPGIVRRVLGQEPTQQGTAARDRKADREGKLVAERAVIRRGGLFWLCSRERTPDLAGAVKPGACLRAEGRSSAHLTARLGARQTRDCGAASGASSPLQRRNDHLQAR